MIVCLKRRLTDALKESITNNEKSRKIAESSQKLVSTIGEPKGIEPGGWKVKRSLLEYKFLTASKKDTVYFCNKNKHFHNSRDFVKWWVTFFEKETSYIHVGVERSLDNLDNIFIPKLPLTLFYYLKSYFILYRLCTKIYINRHCVWNISPETRRALDTTTGNCCSIWLHWSHWQHRESIQSWMPVGKCFESVWQNQQETSKSWLEEI